MFEVFFEQSNTCNNPQANKGKILFLRILYYVFLILGAVLLFFIIAFLPTPDAVWYVIILSMLFWFLMPISLFVGAFFIKRMINKMNPEFDYVLNGSLFYIVRIINRVKRKKYIQLNLSQIINIGNISLESYNRFAADPNIKKIYAITNPENEDNVYYLLYNDTDKKKLLHFEPNEELLSILRRSLGRDVISKK